MRLVGVHCPLPELERRESERGDRQPGLAAMQYGEVHSHELHDLDIDSSLHTPAECALRIRDFLPDRPRPPPPLSAATWEHIAPPRRPLSCCGRRCSRCLCGAVRAIESGVAYRAGEEPGACHSSGRPWPLGITSARKVAWRAVSPVFDIFHHGHWSAGARAA
ncbi:phosphotransferase-like protein [Streptomyces avermitilis]|uniref:phosphotransferase-like protein n=1 Tax=Streptomyces avermitilis TaxID=33903 RepID=UPI00371BEB70